MKNLHPEAILKGLRTKSFGRSVLCLEKTTSTNDVLLRLAEEGGVEGTVVTAESQTKGRGRQGRSWNSTVGKSLAFSILLYPKLHVDELPGITMAAAVAVARTLEAYHFKPGIKWPNDILFNGKKLCGILTESGDRKGKMTPVILGIGLNLNQGPKDLPASLKGIATSLYLEKGRLVDRNQFLRDLLFYLEETYRWTTEGQFSKVLNEWRKRAVTLNQQVRVIQGSCRFCGQTLDVDEKGALLVRNDLGMVERVISGDVELLALPKGRRKT